MAYIQKSNPFKKHDGGKEHPFGLTDVEYNRVKKEKTAQLNKYKKLSEKDPDGYTLDYGETKNNNSGATNKSKYNELQKYMKKYF